MIYNIYLAYQSEMTVCTGDEREIVLKKIILVRQALCEKTLKKLDDIISWQIFIDSTQASYRDRILHMSNRILRHFENKRSYRTSSFVRGFAALHFFPPTN